MTINNLVKFSPTDGDVLGSDHRDFIAMRLATDLYVGLYGSKKEHSGEQPEVNNMFSEISTFYKNFLALFRNQNVSILKDPNQFNDIVKETVFDDYIVCIEDGKKLKTLTRHLKSLGMTLEQYKKKWNLPHDYPTVCKNYADLRTHIAKATTCSRVEKMKTKKKLAS